MPRSYAERYRRKREYLTTQVDEGTVSDADADAIRELVNAFDEDKVTTKKPRWPDAPGHLTSYREDGTLANWLYFLTTYARELQHMDISLLDATTRDINRVAERLLDGTASVRDDNLSKGTIRAYQNSARIFYRFHEDTVVEFEDIAVFEMADTSINPRDMLTREEIHEVRDAAENPRDKTVIDLLLYCGMRNNALRTLRIKDIDTEDGQWYFNTTADGLKNIYRESAPRPLLGAEPTMRDWLDYHPYSDDPDAYVIIPKPKWNDVDPHQQVSDKTVSRITKGIKEKTDIDKPMHPHMMRHNFVTLCKREYDLDDSTVKFLIGHAPDSTVMETTYAHLSGEDHIEKAERAAGIREDDEESSLTPTHCGTCGEPLAPQAKACERCGTIYTPDAKTTLDDIKDTLFEHAGQADNELEIDGVQNIRDFVTENPKLARKILDEELEDS